ncbi:serine hydrolase domain-containing protein [Sorangium sp. So ce1504]|uniref:serine hydrolase domain-containing protein n=1 Tax=Sorangium sp. So ce1504 TaxID=3133337 RepID=UPI003F601185
MKLNRWIAACFGVAPSLVGCATPQPEIEQTASEERVQASSDRLDFIAATPPPLVNTAHDDLAWKLDDYTGYPAPGALTPGMIAAVVKGKHIVALGAAGFAKLPEQTPMTEDMIFNIGSNTKSMTATLLSILIEESPALDWDTTLAEALPWATEPGKEYIKPAARKNVTLRQLVAHRSGIACSYEVGDATVDNQLYSHPDYSAGWKSKTHQQVLKEYVRGPSIPVGGNATGLLADCSDTIGVYRYENANFTIAQAVIDQWAGMAFIDYAREKLIDAHGFGTTYQTSQAFFLAQSGSINGTATQRAYWNPYFFNPTHPYLAAGKFVWGHNEAGTPHSVLDPDVDPWAVAPGSGGFAFNILDWARYAIAHMRDTSPAFTNVHALDFSSYNYGWSSGPRWTSGGIQYTGLCHSGSITGMRSKICVYPELDIAYLSFANGGPDAGAANENVVTWMASQPAYARTTGGCKDDPDLVAGVQRFWDDEMFGCAGSVTYPDRADLCKTGYHVCSAAEFVEKNSYGSTNAEAPKHHYWTDDNLKYTGVGSGSCSAAPAGMSCGASTPMRVCSPDGVDPEGNQCNWVNCGHGDSTQNRYFGGCAGNTTAGTLCCKS